jgi:hypothetical protein
MTARSTPTLRERCHRRIEYAKKKKKNKQEEEEEEEDKDKESQVLN